MPEPETKPQPKWTVTAEVGGAEGHIEVQPHVGNMPVKPQAASELTRFNSFPESGPDEHSQGLERFISNFEDDTEL
jgi:hypothetical protein